MINQRIPREKIEFIMRVAIAPVLRKFAKRHYPEVQLGMLKDLNEGIADYIASSFENYQDDLDEENLELIAHNRSYGVPMNLPLESCGIKDL